MSPQHEANWELNTAEYSSYLRFWLSLYETNLQNKTRETEKEKLFTVFCESGSLYIVSFSVGLSGS
jgi:hypothetical protein